MSVIVFGWQTRCEAELFKAALPLGPFVWHLEVKGQWGLQPDASHPTSDTMYKMAPWLRQQLTCGSTVCYSALSFCRCGIQRHGVGTVDTNGVHGHSESTCLGLAVAALQLLGGILPSMTLSLATIRSRIITVLRQAVQADDRLLHCFVLSDNDG